MSKNLDFIIIGAQKAGSSSLAAYLNESPDIFIPPEKEIPFFLGQSMHEKGWNWYIDVYFKKAKEGQLLGTSTPQYMMYPECFSQIKFRLPDAKLIAILRDPVKRLISHFDMATRNFVEDRSINEVVGEQLGNINHYRKTPYNDRTGKYIVFGEYGRILSEVLRNFDSKQLLVLDFEELKRDAQQVVNRICQFLGVSTFYPSNINIVRMQGGSRKKINLDHDSIIRSAVSIAKRTGFKLLLPEKVTSNIHLLSSWLDQVNVDPKSKSTEDDIESDLLERLKAHYLRDQKMLERMGYPEKIHTNCKD